MGVDFVLGIHLMELKALARLGLSPDPPHLNPFNGIERQNHKTVKTNARTRIHLMELKGCDSVLPVHIVVFQNPFNGIERGAFLSNEDAMNECMNPFNGIERCSVFAGGVKSIKSRIHLMELKD